MTRQPTVKSLKNKADRLWAAKVRANARDRCEYCGRETPPLDAHHVKPRTYHRLRYVPRNGVLLCRRHHLYWAHKDPLEFAEWFQLVRPADYAYVMNPENVRPMQRGLGDYIDLCEELAA